MKGRAHHIQSKKETLAMDKKDSGSGTTDWILAGGGTGVFLRFIKEILRLDFRGILGMVRNLLQRKLPEIYEGDSCDDS